MSIVNIVSDEVDRTPKKRVVFQKQFTHGDQVYPAGARAYIPTTVADKAIKEGRAKEIPFHLVGNEDKAVKPAQVKTK